MRVDIFFLLGRPFLLVSEGSTCELSSLERSGATRSGSKVGASNLRILHERGSRGSVLNKMINIML